MKRVLLAMILSSVLFATAGCLQRATRCGDGPCASGGCRGLLGGLGGGRVAEALYEARGWRHQRPELGPAGPPVGTYAYPYYTLHGPRDFLADDPPSLGN